jgi:hypothetical protein
MTLQERVNAASDDGPDASREAVRALVRELRCALSAGEFRAAEPDPAAPWGWRVND